MDKSNKKPAGIKKKIIRKKSIQKLDKGIINNSQTSTPKFSDDGKTKKKKKKFNWKIFRICLFIFIALCIVATGVVIGVITGVIDKTDSIGIEELELLKLTSFVYDKDGNEIGTIYDSENRINVKYDAIPKTLVDAVVSIEDERFFKHGGVDIKRTAGAVMSFVLNGGKSSFGGSTLTQQLVKNILNDKEATWTRKIREWYRAISIENKMTKQQIFESYVNTIYLGDGAYGVEVASQNYFGKPVKEINLAEAATLAAIIQSPESTNPYRSEEAKTKLLNRKDVVLKKMLNLKKITQDEYNEAISYEIAFKKEEINVASGKINNYFIDAVIEQIITDLKEEKNVDRGVAIKMLYGDGLKIYTTMDQKVQAAIDSAYANDKLFYKDRAGDFMQSAMVVLEQSTGNVVGLIGGAGKKEGNLVLNRATQSNRQPGSCMKPLGAYGPAFEQGASSPGAGLDDCQFTQGGWTPGNYYGYFNGYVTAREALAKSMNIPAVKANQKVDIDFAFNFAKNTGLKNLVSRKQNQSRNDESSASLALGGVTKGFTPLEMANAYATIANGGLYIEPKLYTKVLDRKNKELLVTNSEAKRVMKDSTAFMLTDCLAQVVKTGTAAGSIRVGNMPVAGKTGETNDEKDQWFCGFSPYYTIACWNGYDDPKTINRPYPYFCMRLFNTVLNAISKDQAIKQFEVPNSVMRVALCRDSGLVATDTCRTDPRGDRTLSDWVAKGSVPTATCTVHKTVTVCSESGMLATAFCPKKVEKSFITRDTVPNIKPTDWKFMAPTETCKIHTKASETEDDGKIDIYKE
ncbi:MAG: transglycosylase domain-containing protein [Clostridia bacterium]